MHALRIRTINGIQSTLSPELPRSTTPWSDERLDSVGTMFKPSETLGSAQGSGDWDPTSEWTKFNAK
jgi:hypothetical protein